MLFYFLTSLIFLNFITIFTCNELGIDSKIYKSHQRAKTILSSILPKTLTTQRQNEYELLKKLESKINSIIYSKSTKDAIFKDLVKECLETNNDLSSCCQKLFLIPNLYDLNNEEIDGNVFNIINSFNAYQECLNTILNFLKSLENQESQELKFFTL